MADAIEASRMIPDDMPASDAGMCDESALLRD
jgi:hypothetical protein